MMFFENNQDLISTILYDASDGVWPGCAMWGVKIEVGFKRFVDESVTLIRFWCDCVASGQVFVIVKGMFPSCGRSSFPFS